MAVGSERPAPGTTTAEDYSPLAEIARRNAWSDVSPAPSQTPNDYLQAVSCPSASECIAVGQGVAAVLALAWNGKTWTVQLSPIGAPGMSVLEGISCTSPRRCIAVGYRQANPSDPFRTLAMRWNGISWSGMPTPATAPGQSAVLNAVSCTRHACTAVGGVGYRQLVERWNGRRWALQHTPAGAQNAALNGVSCPSAKRCVAVGALTGRGFRSIAEAWNGHRWSIQPTPAPASGSLLWAVSCAAQADCVAVGQRPKSPFIEHWNGARWSIQPTG
jgi:hypothetical protein